MVSKIKVDFDFDTKEPYIKISTPEEIPEDPDLRDVMVKNFTELAFNRDLLITENEAGGNIVYEIRTQERPEIPSDLLRMNASTPMASVSQRVEEMNSSDMTRFDGSVIYSARFSGLVRGKEQAKWLSDYFNILSHSFKEVDKG